MKRLELIVMILIVCAFPVATRRVAAQSAPERSATVSDPVARTRALYFQRDYAAAIEVAHSGLATDQDSPELRAWYIAAMSRDGRELQAAAAADSMAKRLPASPWTLFARAMIASPINSDKDSALALAKRAYDRRPGDADFAWMYARALDQYGEYARAAAVVDSARVRVGSSAELLAMEGQVLATLAFLPKHDSLARPHALEAFREAQRLDSTNVDAQYLEAGTLADTLGDSATVALLRRAAELAPYSPSVHEQYWDVLGRVKSIPEEVKHGEIAADVARIAKERGATPAGVYLLVNGYDALNDTVSRAAAIRRLEMEFANTPEAEEFAYQSQFRLTDSINKRLVADSAAAERRLREGWRAFIARPMHFGWGRLGTAYLQRFSALRADSTTPIAEVLPVIQGMVRYNEINPQWTHVMAPVYLADHKAHLAYAERLVREGERPLRAQVDAITWMTVAELANALDGQLSSQRDALGWVLYAEGKKADARRAFARALRYSNKNPSVYYHLGRIAEWEGKPDSAEVLYAKGLQYEVGRFGAHQNSDALKRVYASRRGGSIDGFDAFVGRLKEQERVQRKARVLAERSNDPKAAPAFSLARLSGGRFTSDSLRGRIAVVNFWGTWCGPCLLESPDIQKLYDRYRKDTTVVLVTIATNDEPKAVRDFMIKRKFDFPVLMDSGFVHRAGINAWPTTWFLDRDGRIAFSQTGASDVVFEEFEWRIEALKGERTATR